MWSQRNLHMVLKIAQLVLLFEALLWIRIRAFMYLMQIMKSVTCSLEGQGEVHKTFVRPAMAYGIEQWAVKEVQHMMLDVAGMTMLRCTSGVTKLERIGNEIIRVRAKVGEISKKVEESRLNGHGRELRRDAEYVVKTGKLRRGRPKCRWLEKIRNDLSDIQLPGEEAQDRFKSRRIIRNIDTI